MSLEFRLIEIEKRNPYRIAAMDQAILEECEAGRSPPTLVYHNWQPSVSIANGQNRNDINHEMCREKGFDVVRLTTGGKAVVHFPDTEFTYSLFVPITGINPRSTYELYCGRIATALRELGVPSAVIDNNDIFVGEKKIGGNAQYIKKQYAMQQGILIYTKPDAQVMLSLMNSSLYPSGSVAKLNRVLTGFRDHSGSSQEQLRETLTSHLLEGYKIKKGTLTRREQTRIRELESSYRTIEEAQAPQVRGLCWMPAPAYLQTKRTAVEARV